MKRRNKLQEQQKAVHYFPEISIALIAVKRWYQQAISTDTTGQTEVSTEFADRGIYVPIKR